jgi:hypothetical protein
MPPEDGTIKYQVYLQLSENAGALRLAIVAIGTNNDAAWPNATSLSGRIDSQG